jgi:hypothetical protein
MQAAMASSPATSMPICASMADSHSTQRDAPPYRKGHATCEFCAAAGHAPICVAAAAVLPSSTVAWTAYERLSLKGPRGPPSITPKSRGPPLPNLTV